MRLVGISLGDRDRGLKTCRTLEGGGELAPKVAPRKLGLLTSKLAIFYRNCVERGQFQGPLEIQNFTPPSNFRRFDPPYPGLQISEKPSTEAFASARLREIGVNWRKCS